MASIFRRVFGQSLFSLVEHLPGKPPVPVCCECLLPVIHSTTLCVACKGEVHRKWSCIDPTYTKLGNLCLSCSRQGEL